MKALSHQLINTNSQKLLQITLTDKKLISETGTPKKLRKTEKEFSSSEEALKNFYKKEWAALKKDFVLNNKHPKIGEAYLHKFIGGGYTGSLSFQHTPKGIFIYKDEVDSLIQIDEFGTVYDEIKLPKQLAWNIVYRGHTNSLILDIDHYIYEYELDHKSFRNLGNKKSFIDSFISVADNKTAFATLGKVSIINNLNILLWKKNYTLQNIKGTTPFCGKLSKDGKLLAFHNTVGELQIINATNGKHLNTITGSFEMITQIEFTNNNKLLVIREKYGTWGMRYFDLSNNQEIIIQSLEIPTNTKNINTFCFNNNQSKLVLVQHSNVFVFDFINKTLLHNFNIEHLVKTCEIKFIGEKLGIRTDYGCFSLYNV
ncbi:hypothetical protein [uncultured Formosa sp.]|uniref:hypothetical protein n=1 Tax=uncultured Formosa sp. TaxID=255435 RepID=UPI00260CE492|nr:hypothetical protein [uncultured Formosa sp.]